MKTKFLAGFVTTVATLTTVFAAVSPATAGGLVWKSEWNTPGSAPTPERKTQTGFNDTFFQQFVQQEKLQLAGVPLVALDPNRLKLKYDHDVSVFFINEGAGYRNQLAYETKGTTNQSGLVFEDIATPEAVRANLSEVNGPLRRGDRAQLGMIRGGSSLDFALRANGRILQDKFNTAKAELANLEKEIQRKQASTKPKDQEDAAGLIRNRLPAAQTKLQTAETNLNNARIYGTQATFNPDALPHAVAYAYKNYIVIGFEDLYGEQGTLNPNKDGEANKEKADRDFNDVVFVVDVGVKNVNALIDVPEPSLMLGLGIGAVGLLRLRRRQGVSAET